MTEFSVGLGHSQAQGAMPRLREQLPELGAGGWIHPVVHHCSPNPLSLAFSRPPAINTGGW
jgi:hypothetical protein